jgi:hypothetical protein
MRKRMTRSERERREAEHSAECMVGIMVFVLMLGIYMS